MSRQNRLERFWSTPYGVDPKGDGHEARRNDRMSESDVYSLFFWAGEGLALRAHPGEEVFMSRQNRLERFWSTPYGVDPKGDGHEARRNDRMPESGAVARMN